MLQKNKSQLLFSTYIPLWICSCFVLYYTCRQSVSELRPAKILVPYPEKTTLSLWTQTNSTDPGHEKGRSIVSELWDSVFRNQVTNGKKGGKRIFQFCWRVIFYFIFKWCHSEQICKIKYAENFSSLNECSTTYILQCNSYFPILMLRNSL